MIDDQSFAKGETDQDYKKLHENFDHYDVLKKIHEFLLELANELEDIGINLQIGQKKHSDSLIDEKIQNERLARLMAVQEEISKEKNQEKIGRKIRKSTFCSV